MKTIYPKLWWSLGGSPVRVTSHCPLSFFNRAWAAGDCDQLLVGEDYCQNAICMAAGFSTLTHIWEETEVFVRKFLWLHLSQFMAFKNPHLDSPKLLTGESEYFSTHKTKAKLVAKIKIKNFILSCRQVLASEGHMYLVPEMDFSSSNGGNWEQLLWINCYISVII